MYTKLSFIIDKYSLIYLNRKIYNSYKDLHIEYSYKFSDSEFINSELKQMFVNRELKYHTDKNLCYDIKSYLIYDYMLDLRLLINNLIYHSEVYYNFFDINIAYKDINNLNYFDFKYIDNVLFNKLFNFGINEESIIHKALITMIIFLLWKDLVLNI